MIDTNISGMDIYYYNVCKKKLWYYANSITMEHTSEDVKIGKMLDEGSYREELKNICIDNTINIDFIRDKNELHEVKKSRSIEDASVWQLKYYIYYLKNRDVEIQRAFIDYPLLKRKVEVRLDDKDIKELEYMIIKIKEIKVSKIVPKIAKMKICSKCSYHDMCFI
ncbi:MAG: CRISPR-associated protein Cas4 [Acidaminobacteraceae bacterium]